MKGFYSIQFVGDEQQYLTEEAKKYCIDYKVIKSSGAVEIISLIFTGLDLVVALICIPQLAEAASMNKVTIKKNGSEIIIDKKKTIIKELTKDCVLRKEIIDAYQNGELTVLSTAKNRQEILNKLKEIIENENSD